VEAIKKQQEIIDRQDEKINTILELVSELKD